MVSEQNPYFKSLDQPPSWCNAAGAIDRSACVEIRLSEVRRLAGCVEIDPDSRDSHGRPLHITRPLPDERPARNGRGRVATGVFTITAADIESLHLQRDPRRLAGDLRTARANAMRPADWQPSPDAPGTAGTPGKSRFPFRMKKNDPRTPEIETGLSPNPNVGQSRTKTLALPPDWSQPLRIEKWIFPTRIQPAYYLVCPGCIHHSEMHHRAHRDHREQNGFRKDSDKRAGHFTTHAPDHKPNSLSSVLSVCSVVNSSGGPPPLSTRPPGREDPSTGKCPQRTLKLMMIQCTPVEAREAYIVQLWINSLPPSRLAQHRPFIARLLDRYGPIFSPRLLLCPRCLRVRYGNNPETVRQGWRRRNHKTTSADLLELELLHHHYDLIRRYESAMEGFHHGEHAEPTRLLDGPSGPASNTST